MREITKNGQSKEEMRGGFIWGSKTFHDPTKKGIIFDESTQQKQYWR